MNAWDTAIGVVLGAGVMVISDVVTFMDSCESTEGREASAKKTETRILTHMEPRNLSGLTGKGKWMWSRERSTGPPREIYLLGDILAGLDFLQLRQQRFSRLDGICRVLWPQIV
jgi:hypothetical protein